MIHLAITVIICLIAVAIVILGTVRHGWSNFYLATIGMVVVVLPLAVVVYLT